MGARYSDRFFRPDAEPDATSPPTPTHDQRSTARYSDRFFGPAAAPEPSPSTETIDLARGSSPPPPADVLEPPMERAWYAEPVARVALAAAVVLGAAGGAYGWELWRDRQQLAVAQSTADVSAEAFVLDYGASGRDLSVSVRLRNAGTFPLTLTAYTPADPRLTPVGAPIEPVELEPAEDVVRIVHLAIDCDADVASTVFETGSSSGDVEDSNNALVAHLRTVDGAEHEQAVAATGLGTPFASMLSAQCSYRQAGFSDIYPEVVAVGRVGTDVVTAQITLHSYAEDAAPVVEAVSTPSDAFAAEWEQTGSGEAPAGTRAITVRWSVRDCAEALTADDRDMLLEVRGSLPSDDVVRTATGFPTPGLVGELVRLSERVCG